ncbi:MAG: hypothetical protein RJA22_1450 [Verrucomicrobiota bacterium]|jgi:hypothetical protein
MKATALLLPALLLAASLPAAEAIRYQSVPNASKMRMDGDSTIHKWWAETAVIGGAIEAAAGFPESAKGASAPLSPKVDVIIPVRTLKASGGKRMDAVMQEHLKAADHKNISYRVLELTPKGAGSGAAVNFEAKGTLTVAGVTQTNAMAVAIERVNPTRLKVTGTIPLKMTDFGIKPPAPEILGMSVIKTDDLIKLNFEWVTEQAKPTP